MGHSLAILKLAKEQLLTSDSYTKAPAVKLPSSIQRWHHNNSESSELTGRCKWQTCPPPPAQTNILLYNCAEEAVQTSIIKTYPNFFSENPNRLIDMEVLVTQKSNSMVHRLSFATISQGPGESVQQFVVRLRDTAQDFDFICSICNHNLSDIYIKDQLVRYTSVYMCIRLLSSQPIFDWEQDLVLINNKKTTCNLVDCII